MNKGFFFMFALLNAVTVSPVLASETLYYIIKKAHWSAYATKATYRPPALSEKGFIPLLTPEQLISTAQALHQGQSDLLLLKLSISSGDPLLKWENAPGNEVSHPHYYGQLPRTCIKNVYPFKPEQNGHFAFPNDPFLKQLMGRAVPSGTVNRFLAYHNWQKTARFQKLQTANFLQPKVQLQWWYFDFFLRDGSSVVLAFIPQNWFDKSGSATEKESVFTMALKTKEGVVKRFVKAIPQSNLQSSADRLEIPAHLLIQVAGSGTDRTYSIRVNYPEIAADFTITPTRPPFAAFPTGFMPGVLRTLLNGVAWGGPGFSYVSQIPNSTMAGSLHWEEYQASIEGQAYHEQGRLNDTPERQGGSWTWYHFSGDGWNIFGSPGSYIYLQQGDRMLRSGVHLIKKQYRLQNRAFSSPEHPKLLTGGEVYFHHEDLQFRLTLSPSTAKTLVCFPSPDPNQVWGTVGGPATLSITEGPSTKTLAGQMFLETCSWQASEGSGID